jgi:hypothetical protein
MHRSVSVPITRPSCMLACMLCGSVEIFVGTNGVVIATEKKMQSTLIDDSSVQKISVITENIGTGPPPKPIDRPTRYSSNGAWQ